MTRLVQEDQMSVLDMSEIVGRDRERAVIEGFFDGVGAWPSALVLGGVPGIGKTALWEAAIAAARSRSYRVLVGRPTGAEAQLSFSGLADLLADVPLGILRSLPEPQRQAVEFALQLETSHATTPPPLALPLALLGILRAVETDGPVVVGIDDAQWLDAPSATVLAYAWRRLRDERVALVATRRAAPRDGGTKLLDQTRIGDRVTRVEVGPLTVGALNRLLRLRLGQALPRRSLVRLHRATAGNPLYALEVVRAWPLDALEAGGDFFVPATLEELLGVRIGELPARVQRVLLAVSALADPTVETLSAALPRTPIRAIVREGAAAEVVVLEGERVRFTHPLFAAAVYSAASADSVRAIHRRLSEVVDETEERARHLALAAEGPDETVAAALDEAAAQAAARGAPAVAAELLELAITLTPVSSDERLARLVSVGRRHLESGDFRRARTFLEEAVDVLPSGGERAGVLTLLLETFDEEDEQPTLRTSERALVDAVDDERRQSDVHTFLARYWTVRGQNARALESARTAYALAERSEDPAAVYRSATYLARAEIRAAELTPGLLERALAVDGDTDQRVIDSPRLALAHLRLFQGALAEARTLCEELLGEAETRGDFPSTASLHGVLGHIACRACEWQRAAEHAATCLELGAQVLGDDALDTAQDMALAALIDAHVGSLDRARTAATKAATIADRAHGDFVARRCRAVIGFAELSIGNAAKAAAVLTPVVEELIARGFAIAPHPVSIEPLEALIAVGDVERARPLVARYLEEARRLESPMLQAMGDRCRGLLASADGDPDTARAALEHARAAQHEGGWDFDLARTLLASGHVERRAKQKRAARESFAAALAIFDRLGTSAWSDQTRLQLGRVGGRPPASTELTPAEERVATLVAAGRTNSETAAQLHLSEHTVEGHLSRIYAKLGVHSRSQLTRQFLSDTVDGPSNS